MTPHEQRAAQMVESLCGSAMAAAMPDMPPTVMVGVHLGLKRQKDEAVSLIAKGLATEMDHRNSVPLAADRIELDALNSPAVDPPQPAQEPVAWITEDHDSVVTSAELKELATSDPEDQLYARSHSIPLYAAPSQEAAAGGAEAEFEIQCNDEWVAHTSGPREHAYYEALHYAMQYASEGPVELFEVIRKPIAFSSPALHQQADHTADQEKL